jgi:hypothetical protein
VGNRAVVVNVELAVAQAALTQMPIIVQVVAAAMQVDQEVLAQVAAAAQHLQLD